MAESSTYEHLGLSGIAMGGNVTTAAAGDVPPTMSGDLSSNQTSLAQDLVESPSDSDPNGGGSLRQTESSSSESSDQPGNGVSMRTLATGVDLSLVTPNTRQDRQFSAPAAPSTVHLRPGWVVVGSPGADSSTDSPGTCKSSSRLHLVSPSLPRTNTPMRRRRSSWAAGVWPVSPRMGQSAGGLEELSPEDLYRQFVSIRDAVLKKVGSNGRAEQRPDAHDSDGDKEDEAEEDLEDDCGATRGASGTEGRGGSSSRSSRSSASSKDRNSGSSACGASQRADPDGATASPAPCEATSAASAAGVPKCCPQERATWCVGRRQNNQSSRGQPGRSREPSIGGAEREAARTPPHSPHRLSQASYAEEASFGAAGSEALSAAAAGMDGMGGNCGIGGQGSDGSECPGALATAEPPQCRTAGRPVLVITVPNDDGGGNGQQQQQPQDHHHHHSSPRSPGAMIDLQQYYYSPSASGEAAQPLSPFAGAVIYASDCVAYNALYGRGGAAVRPLPAAAAASPHADEALGEGGSGEPATTAEQSEQEKECPGEVSVGQPAPQEGLSQEGPSQEGWRCSTRTGPCLRAGFRMEACSSMPRTESLFSLHPSGEPQPGFSQMGSQETGQDQEQQQQMLVAFREGQSERGAGAVPACSRSTGGGAAQMLVWQEELTSTMPDGERTSGPKQHQAQRKLSYGGLASSAGEEPSTPGTARHVRTFTEIDTVPGDGEHTSDGSDSTRGPSGGLIFTTGVVGGLQGPGRSPRKDQAGNYGSGGGSGDKSTGCGRHQPSSDYLEAVRSVAQCTLLPLPRMGGLGSAPRRGATCSFDADGSAGGAAGVTPRGPPAGLGHLASAANAKTQYGTYVHLPLPRLPSSGLASAGPAGAKAALLPPPCLPQLHSVPVVMAATANILRKCLDKGIPFAVMPAEHFAAVVAAAEQHDGPLAYHIISTHCTYYPGLGRPAASSGGGLATAAACAGTKGAAAIGTHSGGGSATAATMLISGGSGGKRTTKAATDAAAAVSQLLAEGKPLHVMSPSEYQRLLMGVQYGIRSLHDLLLAQPATPAAGLGSTADSGALEGEGGTRKGQDARRHGALESGASECGTAAATAGAGSGILGSGGRVPLPALPPIVGGGGPMVRRHRRGSSIGSDCSFTAAVGRLQSGAEAMAGVAEAAPGSASQGQRAGLALGSMSASPAASAAAAAAAAAAQQQQQQQELLQPATRLRALIQAVQMGNMCRVAYLVEHGADVNATDTALHQQATGAPAGSGSSSGGYHHHHSASSGGVVRSALAGAFAVGTGASTGGRTPLHYAAEAGSFGVAQLLLHFGAFVGVRDGTGRTAHEIARRKGHLAVAQLLKDAADRRRDVVRSCAAEDRASHSQAGVAAIASIAGAIAGVAVAPPPPRPPAPLPKSKQMRCNSAPTGPEAAAATAAAAAAVVAAAERASALYRGTSEGTGAPGGGVGVSLLPPRSASLGDAPEAESLSSRGSKPALQLATALSGAGSTSNTPRGAAGSVVGTSYGTPAQTPRQPEDDDGALGSPLQSEELPSGLSLGSAAFAVSRSKQQLSVVLESEDLQQHLARRRSGKRVRWLACFGCGM